MSVTDYGWFASMEHRIYCRFRDKVEVNRAIYTYLHVIYICMHMRVFLTNKCWRENNK